MAESKVDEKESEVKKSVPSEPAVLDKVDKEIEEMFRAGVHFGYSRSRRHPSMKSYLFGLRNNVDVFDLQLVNKALAEAEKFLKDMVAEKKIVLFVGTKPAIAGIVEKYAKKAKMPYVSSRWIGGLLTNFKIIRKRMDYFEDLKQKEQTGELDKYTKKEQHDFKKEIGKLESKFKGFVSLRSLPDALLIVDPKEESTALAEANKMGIPVVVIANTDCNGEKAQYVIPANDAAPASVDYLLKRLSGAFKQGKEQGVKK